MESGKIEGPNGSLKSFSSSLKEIEVDINSCSIGSIAMAILDWAILFSSLSSDKLMLKFVAVSSSASENPELWLT